MIKRGLGKGLEALIPSGSDLAGDFKRVTMVAVEQIEPNAHQPRRNFDETKLKELAESVKEHGVVQPIVVRPLGSGRFGLVAGERRLRACRLLGMESIPAVIKDFSDSQITEVALIENIQREDLSPIEEAGAFRTLIEEYGFTQEQLARRLGKSRPYIANVLRLLHLPKEVQEQVGYGQITAGHARSLLSLEEHKKIIDISREVVGKGLSVRATEELVRRHVEEGKKYRTKKHKVGNLPEPNIQHLADELQEVLGTRVRIRPVGEGGMIEIVYFSSDDLSRVMDLLLSK